MMDKSPLFRPGASFFFSRKKNFRRPRLEKFTSHSFAKFGFQAIGGVGVSVGSGGSAVTLLGTTVTYPHPPVGMFEDDDFPNFPRSDM